MVTVDFNMLIALQISGNLTQIASKLRHSWTEASKNVSCLVDYRLICAHGDTVLPSSISILCFLCFTVFLQVRQMLPSPAHVLPSQPLTNWLHTLHSLGTLGTPQDRMQDELKTKMTNTYTLSREAILLGYTAFRRFGSYSCGDWSPIWE